MKRRKLLQTIAAAPALAAVTRPAPAQTTPAPPAVTKLSVDAVSPDVVAQPVHRYFTPDQYAALEHLGTLLVPKTGERPGAAEADAARFLDFLISQSPEERQTLYKAGLDRLNAEAKKRGAAGFAKVDAEQAASILKPLTASWTYSGPSDSFARFLISAKEDFLRATVNSRPFVTAMSKTVRGYGGTGYYWFPVE
jgi:hypothetical protein